MPRHTSIRMTTPSEPINITPLNPMVSKCQIKVCYVSDEPNRNRSIITKDAAKKIANSLPGSPIVGFYNEYEKDFEEHNKQIDIKNHQMIIKEITKPYGFVDFNAKCWFQKFLDDGKHEREYLMTEGWLWTGQYPEVQRVVEKGNNHSMNLDNEYLSASWTKPTKDTPQIFIINEAVITNLCILGENEEPCFEGSTITGGEFSYEEQPAVVQFSFDDVAFKEEMCQMMEQLKEILNKGGSRMFTTYAVTVGDSLWTDLYNYVETAVPGQQIYGCYVEGDQKFAVLHNVEDNKFYRLNFSLSENDEFSPAEEISELTDFEAEAQFKAEDIEAFETEYKKKKEEEDEEDKGNNPDSEDKSEGQDSGEEDKEDSEEDKKEDPEEDPEDEDKKKKKKGQFSLEDCTEYQDLLAKFNKLEEDYNQLKTDYDTLTSEMEPLKQFKLETERKDKEAMINRFYMLSDEDKADVVKNIDTYSLDDIEAKLSVICVRNKVSFDLEDDKHKDGASMTFNFDDPSKDATIPAWVKAAMEVAKDMN